jgi:hypothetical protein
MIDHPRAAVFCPMRNRPLAALAAIAALALPAGCGDTGSQDLAEGGSQTTDDVPLQTAAGYVGGEKMLFLQNEKVIRILAERHGIAVDATKAGSIEMVTGLETRGKDFLWPSNDLAVEFFHNSRSSSRA